MTYRTGWDDIIGGVVLVGTWVLLLVVAGVLS